MYKSLIFYIFKNKLKVNFKISFKKIPKGTYGQEETRSCIRLRLPGERPFDHAYELNELSQVIQVFSTGLNSSYLKGDNSKIFNVMRKLIYKGL